MYAHIYIYICIHICLYTVFAQVHEQNLFQSNLNCSTDVAATLPGASSHLDPGLTRDRGWVETTHGVWRGVTPKVGKEK